MKRYWLFGGNVYYPQGGITDFIAMFDTIEDTIKHYDSKIEEIATCGYGWFHVYDSELREVIRNIGHNDYDTEYLD